MDARHKLILEQIESDLGRLAIANAPKPLLCAPGST